MMQLNINKKTFALIAILNLICFSGQGQKIEKVYKRAENFFYSELLEEALFEYEIIKTEYPDYKDIMYKAEICSLLTVYREKPIDQLVAYGDTFGKEDKFYHYWLGRVYVREYMYEEARVSFQLFLDEKAHKTNAIEKETRDFIKEADKRLEFFYSTDNYEIHQLDVPINSEAAELSPAFFPATNELLFASSRGNVGGVEKFSIYHAVKEKDKWTDVREITILGSFSRDNANIEVVNEDGKLFMFSPKNGGDIYFSESRNNQWVKPVEFDSKVTTTHLQSHFYINEHEDRIIFATSGKSKKKTDLDLYQTFRDPSSGKWSKPAPFNLVINSSYDEDSPFLTADEKTLYFSSNGHGSVGGFDVFRSDLDTETLTWSDPVNLGFPINSPDDEVHFKMNEDGKGGYFSSNRLHTKGDYDIYFFWEVQKTVIEGRILNLSTNQAISNGTIRFTPSQYTDEHFRSEVTAKGQYNTEIIADEVYLVEIIQNGKVVHTDEFEIHETGGVNTTYIKDFRFVGPGRPQPGDIVLPTRNTVDNKKTEEKKITPVPSTPSEPSKRSVPSSTKNTAQTAKTGSIQDLNKSYATGRKAILHNIYFAFGTSGLGGANNEVLLELLKVLKDNPPMKIEIGGHTDNLGSRETNLWMSKNRAATVRKWLVQRGIDPARLIAKGYGESYPLASNDDEENGRELNRRIEIFVVQ
ncbi:MAG: outer membrane protein OmpA-like peptidoglycan-associated protein [Cyclobacteriaceae bacterium]|jgi:outer membrane protein OmpA-like peptidoglycan-associated protein